MLCAHDLSGCDIEISMWLFLHALVTASLSKTSNGRTPYGGRLSMMFFHPQSPTCHPRIVQALIPPSAAGCIIPAVLEFAHLISVAGPTTRTTNTVLPPKASHQSRCEILPTPTSNTCAPSSWRQALRLQRYSTRGSARKHLGNWESKSNAVRARPFGM